MVEPTGHCPYLGLKQNRAIRFSSPTPEHRCYVGGEPIEIPVDQASYCLSRGHVGCPLYMGLGVPTTPAAAGAGAAAVQAAHTPGLRGWFAALPPRDRAIYALMIGMLALIVLIYLVAGLQSLARPSLGSDATPPPAPNTPAPPTEAPAPPTETPAPLTPSPLPTSTPEPPPTEAPTQAPTSIPPTAAATPPPIANTVVIPTAALPTAAPATALPTRGPATPTRPPASAAPTQTSTLPASTSSELLWLYFADESGSLYVPVQRRVQVEGQRVAEAAVRELIRGPRGGLARLVLPDVALLDLTIRDGTAYVNFDRPPNGTGDERGLYSIVLSLTHFSSIQQVQFLVNGQPYGLNGTAPIRRPVVNPLNPDGLAFNYRTTEFLPTYYPTAGGDHDVRIIRMVPKTRETAAGTVLALLEGPGEYGFAVQEVIPDGTALLGVRIDGGVATVNLSSTFLEAGDRRAAVRTLVQSLTSLEPISGVRVEVEGQSLGALWGEEYGSTFPRPLINLEEG